ncbi:MAG: energy transducer TonB [Elusimicrobiota bacterium]|nr:energy transducer TonB [Elusimicrobiota bacterium]
MTLDPVTGAGMKRDLVYSLLLHAAFFLALPYLAIKAPMRFMEVSLSAEMSTVPQNLKRPRRRAQKTEKRVRTWTPGEGEPVPAANIAPEKNMSMPAPEIRDESSPDISAFEEESDIETPLPDKMLPFFEGKEGQSFQISGPVSNRAVLRRIYPEYPRSAQLAGISGETTVKFWVSADGIIERVIIEKTSGSEELDRSAVDTVKKWLFAPLGEAEAQIDQWGILNVRFELK